MTGYSHGNVKTELHVGRPRRVTATKWNDFPPCLLWYAAKMMSSTTRRRTIGRRARLVMMGLLLLSVATLAQPAPVEVEMVPPSGQMMVVVAPDVGASVKESGWMAPERVCQLCMQKVGPHGCGCELPMTQVEGNRLYPHLTEVLNRASDGKLALKQPVEVRLVSGAAMRQLGGEKLLGLYQDGAIYLSLDLTTREAFAVMAHEYGHAWLFQHRTDIDAPSEELFEGFAEFVSYLAAAEVGDHRTATSISEFDTSVYGRGARKLLAVYHRGGLDEVLRRAVEGKG